MQIFPTEDLNSYRFSHMCTTETMFLSDSLKRRSRVGRSGNTLGHGEWPNPTKCPALWAGVQGPRRPLLCALRGGEGSAPQACLPLPCRACPTCTRTVWCYLQEELTPVGAILPMDIVPNPLRFQPSREIWLWLKANSCPQVGLGRACALTQSLVWILFHQDFFLLITVG